MPCSTAVKTNKAASKEEKKHLRQGLDSLPQHRNNNRAETTKIC